MAGIFAPIALCACAQQPQHAPSQWERSSTGPNATGALSVASFDPGLAEPSPDCIPSQNARNSHRERLLAQQLFLTGAKAFEQNDVQAAEAKFLCAAALDPQHSDYLFAADTARQYRVSQLLHRAEEARREGRANEARAAFSEAEKLDPRNPLVSQFIQSGSAVLPEIRTADPFAPIRLEPGNISRSFHLRMDQRELIPQALSAYGIQAIIDSSVSSRTVLFDITDLKYADAARLIQLATDTFFVPLDPQHVLVAADTRENRIKYQEEVTETFTLSGFTPADLSEIANLARNVLGNRAQLALSPTRKMMTVRAPQTDIEALSAILNDLSQGRSQVQLDIDVYEVDWSKQNDSGIIPPNSATLFNLTSEADSILAENSSLVQEIISSGLASAGDWEGIIALLIAGGSLTGTVFNSPFVIFGGGITEMGAEWNGSAVNMLLNMSNVRSLNHVTMRVLDREEADFLDGEHYPVMTQSLSTTATTTTGVSETAVETVPEVQYIDLGLGLKVKPFVEGSGDILLKVDLTLNSLAGTSLNNIPELANEEYTSAISVRPDNCALMVSAMNHQDSLELTGMPFLNEIPGFVGGTNREDTVSDKDLVVLITPHLVRLGHQGRAGPVLSLGPARSAGSAQVVCRALPDMPCLIEEWIRRAIETSMNHPADAGCPPHITSRRVFSSELLSGLDDRLLRPTAERQAPEVS